MMGKNRRKGNEDLGNKGKNRGREIKTWGMIKVWFSSVLNRLQITSKFNNFHTIHFSKKTDIFN